jgi:hypothetical protein
MCTSPLAWGSKVVTRRPLHIVPCFCTTALPPRLQESLLIMVAGVTSGWVVLSAQD